MSEVELAWAAGFIDGEAHIKWFINKEGYGRLSLTVAQIVLKPLERLQLIFGGGIYGPYKYSTNRQPHWQWIIHGEEAEKALNQMLPLFSVKQEQTKVAIEKYKIYQKIPNRKRGPKPSKDHMLGY